MTSTDQVDDGPRAAARTAKPWGYQLMFAVTPSYAGGVDVVRKGHGLSLQYHLYRDETLYLHDGRLLVELEDEAGTMRRFEMEPGRSIRFCPMRKHRVTALEDSVVFEVSTPQLEDVVRLQDRYGRADKQPNSAEPEHCGQQSNIPQVGRSHLPTKGPVPRDEERSMMLSGTSALVSGGGRGIGRAAALALAREGANVAVLARTESEVRAVAAEIEALGVRGLALVADVTRQVDVSRSVETCLEAFGALDILVNSAGVAIKARLDQTTDATWDSTIDVNLGGPFRLTRAVYAHMCDQGSGSIINVSSVCGTVGKPNLTAYCASKFGLNGFTKALAEEGRPFGVRCNAVDPRGTATRLRSATHPGEDPATIIQPMDVANVVLFLASDLSKYVTGQEIEVSLLSYP
ncbi:MAG TPA: SDR family NAD(P)-dependent oxidoreductase [Anaerolineae bacterium]|nr:SDR family NAD(P)-dependent oxidoreductase [Anaerolineae bacterium]